MALCQSSFISAHSYYLVQKKTNMCHNFFRFIHFILFVRLFAFVCASRVCLVSTEVRTEHQIPWNWSFEWS